VSIERTRGEEGQHTCSEAGSAGSVERVWMRVSTAALRVGASALQDARIESSMLELELVVLPVGGCDTGEPWDEVMR
jgi:hypothetical protein